MHLHAPELGYYFLAGIPHAMLARHVFVRDDPYAWEAGLQGAYTLVESFEVPFIRLHWPQGSFPSCLKRLLLEG